MKFENIGWEDLAWCKVLLKLMQDTTEILLNHDYNTLGNFWNWVQIKIDDITTFGLLSVSSLILTPLCSYFVSVWHYWHALGSAITIVSLYDPGLFLRFWFPSSWMLVSFQCLSFSKMMPLVSFKSSSTIGLPFQNCHCKMESQSLHSSTNSGVLRILVTTPLWPVWI